MYRPKQSQRPVECSTHFRKPQETGIHYHQLELFCFVWRVQVFVVLLDLFVCLLVIKKNLGLKVILGDVEKQVGPILQRSAALRD